MSPPSGDGRSPAPIDRPILEFVRDRLATTRQFDTVAITDSESHLELRASLDAEYVPADVSSVLLGVRWYTNDDFKIHYSEDHAETVWERRWDRHPNPHNSRDHFHPPPDAATPGRDASWPADYRDVLRLVLDETECRIERLWERE